MPFVLTVRFDGIESAEGSFFFRPTVEVLIKSGVILDEHPFRMVPFAELQKKQPITMETDDVDLAAIALVTAMLVEQYDLFFREWSMRETDKMNVRPEQINAGKAALSSAAHVQGLRISAEGAFAMGSFVASALAWRRLHDAGYRWRKIYLDKEGNSWSLVIDPPRS